MHSLPIFSPVDMWIEWRRFVSNLEKKVKPENTNKHTNFNFYCLLILEIAETTSSSPPFFLIIPMWRCRSNLSKDEWNPNEIWQNNDLLSLEEAAAAEMLLWSEKSNVCHRDREDPLLFTILCSSRCIATISEGIEIRRLTIFLLKIALEFNKRIRKIIVPKKLSTIRRRRRFAVICNDDEATLSKSLANYMAIFENYSNIMCERVCVCVELLAITAFYSHFNMIKTC